MSVEASQSSSSAAKALDDILGSGEGEASDASKNAEKGAANSRSRSPAAKTKQREPLENWTAAHVEKWFRTYKDGKYAEEYAGFAGLDGAGLARLSEAEFLSRSKKGDLLFRVVQKATAEDPGKASNKNLVAAPPTKTRAKSPSASQKHNSTLHLNKEGEAALIVAAKPTPKPASGTDKVASKEEKEAPKAAAAQKPPKIATEGLEGTEGGATPKSGGVATPKPETPKPEIVKEKCEVDGCDAIAVQGVYCAHHRVKPPDEDGNSSFSGSFVLGENSAESDKKLHDKLESIFERFAARETQTMDKGRWVAACESLNLVDNKTVRRLDVELVFNVIKPVKGKPVLQFEHFCRGLSQIALKKYPDKGGRSLRYMVRTDLARA